MAKPMTILAVAVSVIVVVAAYAALASQYDLWPNSNGSGEEMTEFEDALGFIEYNSEDDDYGFHVELDGDGWKEVRIFGPDGTKLLDVQVTGAMAEQGLTTLMYESAEYETDELSREEFLERFPEGDYRVEGLTLDGETLVGTMEVTHDIPAVPIITSPSQDTVVQKDQVVVSWEPVTSPSGIEVDIYTVVFAPVDPPDGQEPIDLDIDLTMEVPGDVTSMTIPGDLLEEGAEYQVEVYVKEDSGNQAYAVLTFRTAG